MNSGLPFQISLTYYIFLWFENRTQYLIKTVKKYGLYFFYKQQVYKQLALGRQIIKQLSGLNLLSLSNNGN